MKKVILLTAVILVVASCELIKNATEIDFTSDFKKSYTIDLGENDYSIDEVDTIKIAEDGEALKYKDNLEEVQIDSVVIGIESYTGPEEVIINGSLEYSAASAQSGTIFAQIEDLNITELYEEGKTYKVNYNESEIDLAADILLKDQKLVVYLKGSASDVPVKFKFVIMFYTTVVAQALD